MLARRDQSADEVVARERSARRAVAVVVVTRNRRRSLARTLAKLTEHSDADEIIVVDNASDDGTADMVRARFPHVVDVVVRHANEGAAARNAGVMRTSAPYVAFSDDDSWWAPGALRRAVAAFEAHPRLALLQARVLVGRDRRLDPTCAEMSLSPLGWPPGAAGPLLVGFVACGAVVRRSAFVEVGGFDPRLGIGGEETLIAIDLVEAGWDLSYVDDVVAHHHASRVRDRDGRRRRTARNALQTAWLRRRLPAAVATTSAIGLRALQDRVTRAAFVDAARRWPELARDRRPVSRRTEAALHAIRCGGAPLDPRLISSGQRESNEGVTDVEVRV